MADGARQEDSRHTRAALWAGFHPSQAMSGALAVVDARGTNVLFHATANYHPARGHVERQLMAALFSWTKDQLGTPFILPPGCSVYLYVFNSPCQQCAAILALTIRLQELQENGHVAGWGQAANNTVQWHLGFTRYYLAGDNSYASPAAADFHYGQTLVRAGWQLRVIDPTAAAAAAAPPPAAAAGAAAGAARGAIRL